MNDTAVLPMFPLGTVLFPGAALPLHVFEPRYRALVEACLSGEPEFGVVLIERGSEVGGGDTRFAVGTVARIVETARFPDGRYALATVGMQRLRVRAWLAEDPYPRAEVDLLEESLPRAGEEGRRLVLERDLRRALALATELGASVPPADVRLSEDPVLAGFEAAALAPIGPLDAQRVLEIDDPTARMVLLAARLAELVADLEHRLGHP